MSAPPAHSKYRAKLFYLFFILISNITLATTNNHIENTTTTKGNKMTKVTCEPCNKKLEMIDANWIIKDENKPAVKNNLMWCCDKCLDKMEENS